MTPAARLQTAITLLDDILAGEPAERCLTRWARSSRYAGSRDRAAVRDMVFDCLRQRRSFHWRSGQAVETGRSILCGYLLATGEDPVALFDGSDYGAAQLSGEEIAAFRKDMRDATLADALDFPDFLLPELERSLGDRLVANLANLQTRAPVDLRVNSLKSTPVRAAKMLADEDIGTTDVPTVDTALRVTENARRVNNSRAYRDGLVELQDASSQAVALAAGAKPGMRVVDYCAGGGGKTLALAATMQNAGKLIAHDARPARMKDIPHRAKRAGVQVEVRNTEDMAALHGTCDLVLVDAPCSGTGSWRRNPDAKWRITEPRLRALSVLQGEILDIAMKLVRPGGRLVYATCSILRCENADVVAAFLSRHKGAELAREIVFDVDQAGDGFYFSDIIIS